MKSQAEKIYGQKKIHTRLLRQKIGSLTDLERSHFQTSLEARSM